MVKGTASLVSDFLILIVAGILLIILKDQVTHVSTWLYPLAWAGLLATLVLMVLLKPKKKKVEVVFPRDLAKRIENALPHDAIKLYQSWLVKSLNAWYRTCYEKMPKEALSELANNITDKLMFVIGRMPKDSLYKVLEERNKDNAFVALVFFSALIKALEPKAVKSVFKKPVSAYRDVFVHIDINHASEFLFREHYRLYELGTLSSHQWHPLTFNSDIESHLRWALAPPLIENKSKSCEAPPEPEVKQQPEPEIKEMAPPPKETKEPEPKNETSTWLQDAISELVLEDAISDDSPEHERSTKFFKWLKRQINRKPINADHYFYHDSAKHGEDKLFVSDAALADFYKKTQITSDEIIKSLESLQQSDGKPYQLCVEGEGSVDLICVTIDFDIKVSSELSGVIKEGI